MDIALHLVGPTQEAPEFVTLAPHEFPELQKADLLHLDAGVGFDSPEKVRASPRGKAMAAGSVPQKADLVPHAAIIPTTRASQKITMSIGPLISTHESDTEGGCHLHFAVLESKLCLRLLLHD